MMPTASGTESLCSRINLSRSDSPLDERHDVVEEAASVPGVEEWQDVGMRQVGGDLNLAHEALDTETRRKLWPKHLDCDFAVVLEILGNVHRSHTSAADLPLDLISVSQCNPQVILVAHFG
jgi:hypothetical protein